VVKTSMFVWQTFRDQCTMLDLWLTCDHFMGKVSAIGQSNRPTRPFIYLGSVS